MSNSHPRASAVTFLAEALLVVGALAMPSNGYAQVTFEKHVISTAVDTPESVYAADVDGDGDIDVLSASLSDDKIAWYENDGGSPPTFEERIISTAAEGAQSVFAADVNGDGHTDVLSASFFDSKVAWYENDGESPPGFDERRDLVLGEDGQRSVFAADVDGDGDTDVLSASSFDDTISVVREQRWVAARLHAAKDHRHG